MRKLTCNAEHCKDRDDDGLDDEGGELLQGLLIRLPHLLVVRSIWGLQKPVQVRPTNSMASKLLLRKFSVFLPPSSEWTTAALYFFENVGAGIDLSAHLININMMIIYVGDQKDLCIRKVREYSGWTLNGP